VPVIADVDMATEEDVIKKATYFTKRLNKLLNKSRLQDGTCDLRSMAADRDRQSHSLLVLPTMLQDIIDKADKWGSDGKSGRIDPFTEIYDVSCSFRNVCTLFYGIRVYFAFFSSFSS
jgi:hypothetical protein